MCAASLSAAVTVGGKVKAMKCLRSNRAWLKQSPLPGQEANFMQLTREDEGKRRRGGGLRELWVPNNPIAPHCHLSTTTNQLVKRTKSDIIPNLTIVNVHWSKALDVKDQRIWSFPNRSLAAPNSSWIKSSYLSYPFWKSQYHCLLVQGHSGSSLGNKMSKANSVQTQRDSRFSLP